MGQQARGSGSHAHLQPGPSTPAEPSAQPAPLLTAAALAAELPDGLLVADECATVVLLNPAGSALLATDADRAVGRPLATVLPLRDAAGRSWWTCVDPYASLATVTGHRERELRLCRADGTGTPLAVSARYVRDRPLGRVVRVVVSFRGLRRDRPEADAELLATVAHELRNPMTSVCGFSATLLRSWDRFTDEQRREMLTTVHADAGRMSRLLNDLLDARRVEAGQVDVRPSLVDPAAVLAGIVSCRVANGRPPGVTAHDVRVSVDSGLPDWWADRDKVQQVLDNLIDNGLLHGRPPVRVHVGQLTGSHSAGPRGGRRGGDGPAIVVTVDDSGAGFTAATARRALDKFWRGDGGTRGTGLGLYICRGLVEAHGGTLTLGTVPGGGGRVTVVVPAGDPPG